MGKDTNIEAVKPDPLIGQTAAANAQISKDWLELSREQYNEGLKRQDVTDALTGKVVEQQMKTQDQANAWGAEDRARTKAVFQPLQDEFIQTAKNFDSVDKQNEASAAIKADIAKSAQAQQGAAERNMASMGVNPNSGRFAGITRAADANIALNSAGAGNAARTALRDKAIALKGDALNMGNGLASSAAAAYGIGTNAGNSAVGNNGAANGNFYANGAALNQGMSGAVGANSAAGATMNSAYSTLASSTAAANQQNAANGAANMSAITSVAGMGVSIF